MRTTVELPDALLARAKHRAAEKHMSLKEFFIEAIEQKLMAQTKTRRLPPAVGGAGAPRIGLLTPEQIDEAMFG
jgi:hypothetical protein